MDLLVTEAKWQGTPNLMRHRLLVQLNQIETGNHWIGVKLSSKQKGASPIGAKVWVKTSDRTFNGQIITGDSFQAQHPNSIHFGLGKTTRVQELKIMWPNGSTNVLLNPAVDKYHQF